MKTLLWLDDIRNPLEDGWLAFSPIEDPFEVIWVKGYNGFIEYIEKNGLPTAICFDHDLGEDIARERVSGGMSKRGARKLKRETLSGMDCAKWLVDYCIDNDLDLPKYNIQSANPVGKDNINGLLVNYNKVRAKNN
jgi:hypothetical protein